MSSIYGKAQLVIYKERLYKKERNMEREVLLSKKLWSCKGGRNGNWM